MNWIFLSLLSALFLGLYEIAKKASVRNNAVPPVLFFNVLTSALIYLPVILWSYSTTDQDAGIVTDQKSVTPVAAGTPGSQGTTAATSSPAAAARLASQPPRWLMVTPISWEDHARLFLKALIAGSSWIFASFALKHLPMSIAAPIRASSPFVTILFAVVFMQERPTTAQWFGVIIVVLSFFAFSIVGSKEGIHFHRDRWIGLMVLATLLGAASALYDKYLLQSRHLGSATVQAWFSIYLVAFMSPLFLRWLLIDRVTSKFEWRWSIPMIALLLLVSDFLYFSAIEQNGGLISVISPLRRTSVIIAFIAGIRLYGELNWRPKAICILSILAGVFVITTK